MTCKVLVVDDKADVRDTLQGVLGDEGYDVQAVKNEGEALQAATQQVFDFACVDVRLHDGGPPDESGMSLALALPTRKNPRIRIILLTQYVQTHQIVRAIRYEGAVGFVDKTDADWCQRVLDTIARVCREESEPPECVMTEGKPTPALSLASGETRLAFSLVAGQPIGIRAHGQFVCSQRSSRVLKVPLERYARRTERAWKHDARLRKGGQPQATPSRHIRLAQESVDNERDSIKGIGQDLWETFFEGHKEVLQAYERADDRGKSLSLHFEAPREYLRLPFELLFAPKLSNYVVLQHPVSRFVYDAVPRREALSSHTLGLIRELRVLIVASNVGDPIDAVDAECTYLKKYLDTHGVTPVKTTLILSEQATCDRFRHEIETNHYHIIHYAGHGSYDPSSPEKSALYFRKKGDEQGDPVPMTADQLMSLLRDSETRLVYLSCCEGSAAGSEAALLEDDFLGLADAVVQAGVPSVLGFRWPVSDSRARDFAKAFYTSLLDRGNPETAVWKARCELAEADRDELTWLSPILIHQL